MNITGS